MGGSAADQAQANQVKLQNQALQYQSQFLSNEVANAPEQQVYDPTQLSQEAYELGLGNIYRSQQAEKLVNPAAAEMRQSMGQRVANLTSDKYAPSWANELMKRGIVEGAQTGLSEGSFGKNAFADWSLQQKRQYDLANLAIQQQYLAANQAPVGGLDPGALISGQTAANAANMAARQQWLANITGSAEALGQAGTQAAAQYANMLAQNSAANQQNMMSALGQAGMTAAQMYGSRRGGSVAPLSSGGYSSASAASSAAPYASSVSNVSGMGWVPAARMA
jgi:hypothetical protein